MKNNINNNASKIMKTSNFGIKDKEISSINISDFESESSQF